MVRDIKLYQETIATYGLPALDERFEFIRQLGNVFLVQPGTLKSYVTEDYLGRIDSRLLRPYLAQRSDWGQIAGNYDDLGVGEEPTEESSGNKATMGEGEARSLRERLGMGRLSMMMRELEGLRTIASATGGTSNTAATSGGAGGGYGISGFSFGNMYH